MGEYVKHAIVITFALLCGSNQQSVALAAESGATIDVFTGKACYACHRSKLKAPFVHDALTDGKCVPCHKVTNGNHMSDHRLSAVKDRSSRLCYECHENLSRQKSVHHPILDTNCLSCHAPHASPYENLLRFEKKGLCFQCHEHTLVTEEETRAATGFRDGIKNLHSLHGRRNIPCLTYHDAHASTQFHLIRPKGTNDRETVTITYATTPTGGTCTPTCHDAASYGRK